eukprot:TRINITY_DN8805_c0_g2_i1.p1 TRINITY_DN8805_c0_g2~~TRINITY_DN8805_c0_g2_i1.p1  ORF type:complete len:680 (+),score=127.03 TRINITY_DN8805_c0_g2_i1:121-2160(+)
MDRVDSSGGSSVAAAPSGVRSVVLPELSASLATCDMTRKKSAETDTSRVSYDRDNSLRQHKTQDTWMTSDGRMIDVAATSTNALAFADIDCTDRMMGPMCSTRNFIRAKTEELEGPMAGSGKSFSLRRRVRRALKNPYSDFIAGMIILVDFIAICRDTDAQAEGGHDGHAKDIMVVCFVFYCLELALRLFAHGARLFAIKSNILDVFVVGVSVFEYSLQILSDLNGVSSLMILRMIRLCRLLRLLRVVKLFAGMKELRRLLQMISTCAKTMFWSFLMAFLIMTMWSVLAVELIHPVAAGLAKEKMWDDCERCGRAFGSVMAANLTFIQTVMAGDSWGFLAVPIIEEAPLTAVIFCGVLLTLVYGVMQLITAVVVDSFADMQKMDINALVTDIDAEERIEKELLASIFDKIDIDASGAVSYAELVEGARRVDDFRNWLRVMDVDASDLHKLFRIIDEDSSGEVELEEFIDALYRMKHAESNTATKFVKHIVENLEKKTELLADKVVSIDNMGKQLARMEAQMKDMRKYQRDTKRDDEILRSMEAAIHRASEVSLQAAVDASMDKVRHLILAERAVSTQGSRDLLGKVSSLSGFLNKVTSLQVEQSFDMEVCAEESNADASPNVVNGSCTDCASLGADGASLRQGGPGPVLGPREERARSIQFIDTAKLFQPPPAVAQPRG